MEEEIKKDEPNNVPTEAPNELGECQKLRDEYLNNWKRAVADLANYKKEEMARMGNLLGYAKEGMFENLLPIIDSMYLAAGVFGKDGFAGVEKQIQEFLKKEGIEEILTTGLLFDPNTMEAIGEITNDKFPIPNTVVEELQKGYKMGDKVLRPAKVKVTK